MNGDITLDFIKEQQKLCIIKNKEQIKNYFIQKCKNDCSLDYEYEHEREILFMARHSVSLKYISKYFNLSVEYIKKIALKHKYQSQLLSNFTENENARCFSRSQILRTCEDFNYICPMCFKPLDIANVKSLTGHHVQPFARGGKTIKDNCLPLHVNCHLDDFKLPHSTLFDSSNPLYSAKYFNILKEKLQGEKSGMDYIIAKHCGLSDSNYSL